MSFEEQPQPQSKDTAAEVREQLEIHNTNDFKDVLAHGEITGAAAWLEIAKHDPKYDARWLDHRSRELMNALCEAGRIAEAEKYIDYAQSEEGKKGRQQKIDQLKAEKAK